MIFQNTSERKNSSSGLFGNLLWIALVFFAVLPPVSPAGKDTVVLELGKEGEVVKQKIELMNIDNNTAGTFWNQSVVPMKIPPLKNNNIPLNPVAQDNVKSEKPELYTPASEVASEPSSVADSSLKDVIDGPTAAASSAGTGPISISGPGKGTRIANADGTVTINPYLSTYNNAHYIIRLYDTNGNEIRFNGKPLFTWNRSDDKSYKPLFFKGVRDSNSMHLNGPGDYSPTKNLSYNFPIKQGQKIVVDYGGNPTQYAFMKVQSPAF